MSNQVVVRPLRFSAGIEAMRTFYELLGLRSRVESERGGWIDMVAGDGMVALHDAATSTSGGRAGDTQLCFEADEIDGLRERLVDAGHADATIIDEAFGRALTVTGPGAMPVWIDERPADLYGYKLHTADPDPRCSVTPLLNGADEAEWEWFLNQLRSSAQLSFGGAGDFDVQIELTTTEPLAEVEQRLAAYQPTRDEAGLTVTDPDGQALRVHG